MHFNLLPRPSPQLLALGAALLLVMSVHAVPEARFETAFRQFMRANAGDEAAIEKSADAFSELLKAEPGNPVLLAYAGAATSMKANTTMLPWKKMRHAEDGMALLDKALALLTPAHDAPLQHGVPAALEVRFTAASTFLAVPGFMNRGARGARLLSEIVASPLLAASPPEFKGGVWLKAASLAAQDKRPADARGYLLLVIHSNAPQAEAARAQLKALGS